MRSRRSLSLEQGFTIIEVMIVLGIAGMLTLFVFLAIPTLTRNSRNTTRKEGAASILHAISHYELNHGGTVPSPCDGPTGPSSCLTGSGFAAGQHIIYYDGGSGSDVIMCVGSYGSGILLYAGTGCSPGTVATNTEAVYIYNYQRCGSTVTAAGTTTGTGYSDVVAMYALEQRSGTTLSQCQSL